MTQLDELQERASWRAVFGEPQTFGETTIIPLARVTYGFGGGGGASGAAESGDGGSARDEGAGMGGGLMASPAGVIKITGEDVKIEPYMPIGAVSIAGILMAAWNVYWIAKTIRDVARLRAGEKGR
jgi:uncharacterized spore protein YtfJ